MKQLYYFLCLITASVSAQDYQKNWDQVIRYEIDGKQKSAAKETNIIYKKAVSDKNEPQIIKTFFYASKFLMVLDENAQTKIIENLNTEISRASIPSKTILNLIYAKCLISYRAKNSSKISKRTPIENRGDFLTWSFSDIDAEITKAYEATTANEIVLKDTPLRKYEAIFDFLNTEKFRKESMLEYLLHEKLEYAITKINQWSNHAPDFEVNKTAMFGTSAEFIKIDFNFLKNDATVSILKLFQKLETDYPTSENRFRRIGFCHDYLLKSKPEFLAALKSVQKSNPDTLLLQKILLQKGRALSLMADKEKFPDYNIKAIMAFDSVIKFENRSNAYHQAKIEKQRIQSKSLEIRLQKYTYENENTRAFVAYKNVERFSVSFYKISQKTAILFQNYKSNKDSLIALATKNKPSKQFFQSLKNDGLYFSRTTEILLPQLETGNYLAYFESDGHNDKNKALAIEIINVSALSVFNENQDKNNVFIVLNRKTGKPIENVSLRSSKFSLNTDAEGRAIYKNNGEAFTDDVEFSKGNDTVAFRYYNYKSHESSKRNTLKISFYLDRAIYRPGQTVYYKGIAFQEDKGIKSVVPNLAVKLEVDDPNDNTVHEIEAVTSEFGSFSGEFKIPASGFNGDFYLYAYDPNEEKTEIKKPGFEIWKNADFQNSQISFKVEEYKRPKFEVRFDPVKETYIVGQQIPLTGKATAFTEANISDAKVVYRIEKKVYENRAFSFDEPEIIHEGETKTDASGKFTISIDTNDPDEIPKEEKPIFNYTIHAEITDVSGKTHLAETNVNVAYHALKLTMLLPEVIETKDESSILLGSTNLNSGFVPVKGDLKIYFLQETAPGFKPRIWEKPELESISPTDFKMLFPYETISNDIDPKEQGTLLLTKKIDTEKDKSVPMDFIKNYKSGQYKAIFTAVDKFNNPVQATSEFSVIQNSNQLNPHQLFTVKKINPDPKKDGFVALKVTSVIPEIYLRMIAVYDGKAFYENGVTISGNSGIVKIPIEKTFTTGINIYFESLFENQYFQDNLLVALPVEKNEISFNTISFRNKIDTRIPENWSFQLKSESKFQEYEVLASMYDLSLDKFASENWQTPAIIQSRYYFSRKNRLDNDETNSFLQHLNPSLQRFEPKKEQTHLLWFGFDFIDSNSKSVQKEYNRIITKKSKKPLGSKIVYGNVSDLEGPIAGVSIVVKGSYRGTQTDFDGYYEIEAAANEELEFSFFGYETILKKAVAGRQDIEMSNDVAKLEEVVVTAYGTQKNSAVTGSVTAITEDNVVYSADHDSVDKFLNGKVAGLQVMNYSGQPGDGAKIRIRGVATPNKQLPLYVIDGVIADASQLEMLDAKGIQTVSILKDASAASLYGNRGANGVIIISTKKGIEELTKVNTRKNLSETAFFFPHLKTDASGKLNFSFTTPEALTQWKLRLLAHDKSIQSGYLEKTVVTQKDLMVTPNFSRFFREKDTLTIIAKIANLTKESKTGSAMLEFFDATNGQKIDVKISGTNDQQDFTISPNGNTTVHWKVTIPEGLQGIQYKIVAKSGSFSDGEENMIPVLSNRILVTETLPVLQRENSSKEYSFGNLKNVMSQTRTNHQLTIDYTSHPTWLALQSLSYLMEFEHECAEQTFARFYGNAIAALILKRDPKVKIVIEKWRDDKSGISKTEMNQDLKNTILAETPWFNDTQTEAQKKQKLALLFDQQNLEASQRSTIQKLKQKQKPSGGFGWFDGGNEDGYITRHILAGFGHLEKIAAVTTDETDEIIEEILPNIIKFCDSEFSSAVTKTRQINHNLHYLYARSFFLIDYPLTPKIKEKCQLEIENIKRNWLGFTLYEKTLAALALNRFGEKSAASKILTSLNESSVQNPETGMYWVENSSSHYWYKSPIETQALLIEAFSEIGKDHKSVAEMKVWLLRNKQAKNWPTTKATTEAIYALLLEDSELVSVKGNTVFKVGKDKISDPKLAEVAAEAETGYVKMNWKKDEIKPEMATIIIENKSKTPRFGGIYWQYFEDLDKIKASSGNILSVNKELFLSKTINTQKTLVKISPETSLAIGDLVTVRLEITADEEMQYVNLKDMRASCFEPVEVISNYDWQDGLGFYKSTKDAATHFFFDTIKKGTYIMEYQVRINNKGNFSNGITSIQSMYAPEFSSFTKGIRVNVEK